MAQGQDAMKKIEEKEIVGGVYEEITVEDFEQLKLVEKNLHFRGDQHGRIYWLAAYPAPIRASKRYLGWLLKDRGNQGATITFPKAPAIWNHCRKISLWVYGTELPGVLSILVQDTRGDLHLLHFGRLKFRGWRKMQVIIPDHVVQTPLTMNRPVPIKVIKLVYAPGPIDRLKSWQLLFIDDMTASTRRKLLLPKD